MRRIARLPLVMLSLLAVATCAWAAGESEVRGTIGAVNPGATVIGVLGTPVHIGPGTEIENDDGPIPASALATGQFVEVDGTWTGTQLNADRIRVEDPDESKVKGVINAINLAERRVRIDGVDVQVTPQTQFRFQGQAVPFESFAVGQRAEATGNWAAPRLIARELERHDGPAGPPPPGGEVSRRGPIQAINPARPSITVSGEVFVVVPETVILDNDNRPIPFGALQAGALVQAEGLRSAANAAEVIARRIKLEDGPEIELRGVIQSIVLDPPSMMIAGQLFLISPQTMLLDDENRPIPLAAFAPGDFVQAEGHPTPGGAILARKIKKEDGPGNANEIERRGPITSIDASAHIIVVGMTPFRVTPQTELLGRGNLPIPFSEFRVGDLVEAEGFRAQNGEIIARKVKRENPDHQSVIEGRIQAVDASAETIVIQGVTIKVTDATRLFKPSGEPAVFADLTIGSRALARGRFQPDGSLLASEVRLLPPPPPHHDRVAGIIRVNDPATQVLVIDETTVQVTPETRLLDVVGRPTSFEAFRVGRRAAAIGDFDDAGVLIALQVRLLDSLGEGGEGRRVRFAGVVTAVNASELAFVVERDPRDSRPFDLAVRVLTDEETEFEFRRGGGPATFDDIAVGVVVEVQGAFQPGGPVLATEVKIGHPLPPPGPEVEVHGSIEAIDLGARTLAVRGILFRVTPQTVIEGRHDNPLTLEDLRVGDFVEAKGTRTGPNTADARRIELEDRHEPPRGEHIVRFAGSIEAIPDDATLIVAGRTVHVTASTEIEAFDSIPLTFADLDAGEPVGVAGILLADGSVRARHIRQEIAIISAVDADARVITVNDLDVSVPASAEIKLPGNVAGSFADLTVGQTIRLEAHLDGAQIVADEIRILSPMVVTGIDGYEPLQLQFIDGRAVVTMGRQQAAVGFVYDSDTPAEIHPGSVVVLSMLISSNQPNPALVPQFRVRIGTQNFMRASYITVNPVGSQSITAGLTPKVYRVALNAPADAAAGNPLSNGLYFSFDAFDFEVQPGEPPVSFTIHAIDIDTVPLAEVQTGEVLASWDFAGSSQGWTYETVTSSVFTQPRPFLGDHSIGLAAADDWTFGFWTRIESGLSIAPGTLLRLRATMTSPGDDSARLPMVRVRLADRHFEQIGELLVTPNGPSPSLPNATTQTYDLYYQWPAYAPVMDELVLNFDLINLSSNGAPDVPVNLENVSLETVQFAP